MLLFFLLVFPSFPQRNICGDLFTLGRCAHRFVAIAQWFVHLSSHPQPMQEYRQLTGHRHNRSFPRIFPAALRKSQSPSPQITIFPKGPQNELSSLHQHRSQIAVSLLLMRICGWLKSGVEKNPPRI
jgi:hypothetical protein